MRGIEQPPVEEIPNEILKLYQDTLLGIRAGLLEAGTRFNPDDKEYVDMSSDNWEEYLGKVCLSSDEMNSDFGLTKESDEEELVIRPGYEVHFDIMLVDEGGFYVCSPRFAGLVLETSIEIVGGHLVRLVTLDFWPENMLKPKGICNLEPFLAKVLDDIEPGSADEARITYEPPSREIIIPGFKMPAFMMANEVF